MLLGFEGVTSFFFGGYRFDDFQKGAGGMRQAGVPTIDDAQLSFKLEFTDGDMDQLSAPEFGLHAYTRNQGHAVSHGHEALDGFNSRQLNLHIERSLMAAKRFQDFGAILRRDVVGDKRFGAKLADVHLF